MVGPFVTHSDFIGLAGSAGSAPAPSPEASESKAEPKAAQPVAGRNASVRSGCLNGLTYSTGFEIMAEKVQRSCNQLKMVRIC